MGDASTAAPGDAGVDLDSMDVEACKGLEQGEACSFTIGGGDSSGATIEGICEQNAKIGASVCTATNPEEDPADNTENELQGACDDKVFVFVCVLFLCYRTVVSSPHH